MHMEKPFKNQEGSGEASSANSIARLEALLDEKSKTNGKFEKQKLHDSADYITTIDRKVERFSEYEKTLMRMVERYGYEVELKKVAPNLFEIKIPEYLILDIPEGYARKGGSARTVFEMVLGRSAERARDVDMVKVAAGDDPIQDQEVAAKYSPEDLEHKHGVEPLETDYFEKRDFTINEILVTPEGIYMTKECLLDTVRRIVRFSDFERKEAYNKEAPFYVKQKLLAKAVRLVAEEAVNGNHILFADEEVLEFQNLNAFSIALHFDRALEKGPEVAQVFLNHLLETGQLPAEVKTIEDAIALILRELDKPFVFRSAPASLIEREREEVIEGMADEFESYPLSSSHKKRK